MRREVQLHVFAYLRVAETRPNVLHIFAHTKFPKPCDTQPNVQHKGTQAHQSFTSFMIHYKYKYKALPASSPLSSSRHADSSTHFHPDH
jgi:hypothetical protein